MRPPAEEKKPRSHLLLSWGGVCFIALAHRGRRGLVRALRSFSSSKLGVVLLSMTGAQYTAQYVFMALPTGVRHGGYGTFHATVLPGSKPLPCAVSDCPISRAGNPARFFKNGSMLAGGQRGWSLPRTALRPQLHWPGSIVYSFIYPGRLAYGCGAASGGVGVAEGLAQRVAGVSGAAAGLQV